METRKEIEEKLKGNQEVNQEKKIHDDKMVDSFEKLFEILDAKISDLRASKIKVEDNYTSEFASLKEAIKVHHEAIFECKIPSEVKVINEKRLSFNNIAKQVLAYSYSFALLIVVGTILYANYRIAAADENAQIKFEESNQNLIKLEDQEWFIKFYQYQSKANPKDTQKFRELNPM